MIPRQFLLCLTLLVSLTACGGNQGANTRNSNDNLVQEVWQIVDREYVDGTFNHQDWEEVRKTFLGRPANTSQEQYQAVIAMLGTLQDPYTRFLAPRAYGNLQNQVTGQLTGVGLELALSPATGEITVVAPMEDSPAFRAGLQPNDIIVAIDQVTTKGMDLTGSAAKLRGKPGTKISLGIRRQQRTFTVTLTRAILPINPVRTAIKQVKGIKLGYIRLASFNGNAVTELKKAITSLEKAQVKGYILDLRHNPGGLFAAGVEAAKLWLSPNQTIVSTVTRKGARDVALSTATGPMTNKPLVLLVDSGTASSSEILSGALQDNGRAKLVGTKTFGKGLIQQVYTLTDGSGLAVSIAKYQTPSGRDIHKIGIQPDLKVELPPTFSPQNLATSQDPQFVAAERLLTGS